MNKQNLFIILLCLLITSCGKSKIEVEFERAKIEKERSKEKQKKHNRRLQEGTQKKDKYLDDYLNQIEEKLASANAKYDKIRIFQLARLQINKDQKLQNTKEQIAVLKNTLHKIKNEIIESKSTKIFPFQQTPKELVSHLFYAAKKNDFTKLQYLIDPYGASDSNINQICFLEIMPTAFQQKFINQFQNGRFISQPIITKNTAFIRITTGITSERFKNLHLINRMGYWYFLRI